MKKDPTTTTRKPIIAVIGDSDAGGEVMEEARAVGHGVARRGWHLLCGGGGGVMEAACEGFQSGKGFQGAHGVAVGVIPSDRPEGANRFVDIPILTGMGFARNVMIALSAHAVVVLGGKAGTLSEIAYAWQFGKPVVALHCTGGWASRLAGEKVDDRRKDAILSAQDAEDALTILDRLLADQK